MGFLGVASGPLVRSSFKAGYLYRKLHDKNNTEVIPEAFVMVNPNSDNQPTRLKTHN